MYVALCYYKLDYYDVSQEVLKVYLESFPDSATAINLKACNHFRLYSGKNAETELQTLQELTSPSFEYAQDLIKHNMVVFKNGERALQVLSPLIDVLPEARLNLVIYFLREDELQEAYNLLNNLEPTTPQEYILKGVVNAALGQELDNVDHLKIAQQYFQLVGGSASECDTIPGRQCMASCFFLLKQFDDVLIYLDSIKSYFYNDDTFNFDYGQCLASLDRWKDAEEAFLLIQSERIRNEYTYLAWLAKCCKFCRSPPLPLSLCVYPRPVLCCVGARLLPAPPKVHAAHVLVCFPPRVRHRHHEPQVAAGVGAVPQNGHLHRVVQPAQPDSQRVLPHGAVLLLGKGVRPPGADGPQPRVLGGQARSVRGCLPADYRQPREPGHAAGDPRDPEEHVQPAGRVHHPHHEAVGQRQPRRRQLSRNRGPGLGAATYPPTYPTHATRPQAPTSTPFCTRSGICDTADTQPTQ